jgi:type IX secretion system PorP/SprF family membrane protein
MAKNFLLVLLLLIITNIQAQDVQFTQYMTVSTYLNPAMSGAFDGNYRVRLINRDQWTNFESKSLKTLSVLGDIKLPLQRNVSISDFIGLGLYYLSDRSRNLDYNTNEVNIQVSFHKLLNRARKNFIAGGLGLGITQKEINYDRLLFADQFNGIDEYNLPTSERLPPNIKAVPDLKAGLYYNVSLNKKLRLQTGVSSFYTLFKNISYYSDFDDVDYFGNKKVISALRTTVLANFTYNLNSNTQYFPRMTASFQGPHQFVSIGTNYRKSFFSLKETALHAGANLRVSNSNTSYQPIDLGLMAGFEILNFIIGLSYDFGIRDAAYYQKPTHSFEISLTLIGDYDNEGFICPQF